jgi:hypothetical protein
MNATTVDELTVTTAKVAKTKGEPIEPIDPATAVPTLSQKLTGIAASPLKWMAVTCTLLAISGGSRAWRDWQFTAHSDEQSTSPFALSEIPNVLGDWSMVPGSATTLDPETAQIAGSSDHIIRHYTRSKSGETVSILVLYGLATRVFGHTPEACYPSAGFAVERPMTEHKLTSPGSPKSATYSAGVYSNQKQATISEVVYSFRHAGEWTPEAASRWKRFRSYPGMFKIQIERHVNVSAVEAPIENSPSVELLGELMQEVETRLAKSRAKPAK